MERTALGAFLIDDEGSSAMGLGVLLMLVTLAGLLNHYVLVKVMNHDISGSLSGLVNVDIWWRKCLPQQSSGGFSLGSLLRVLLQHDFYTLKGYALCSPLAVTIYEVLLGGCILLGLIGCGVYSYHDVAHLLRFPRYVDLVYMVVTVLWVKSMSITTLSRLGIWIGVAYACKEIYMRVSRYGRKIGQMVGETVLEAHN